LVFLSSSISKIALPGSFSSSSASNISNTSSVVFALVVSLRTIASSLLIFSIIVGMSVGVMSGYLYSKYDYPGLGSLASIIFPEVPWVG
jgi:hypothetical protein